MPDEIAGRFLAILNPDLFSDARASQAAAQSKDKAETPRKQDRPMRLKDRPAFSAQLGERRGERGGIVTRVGDRHSGGAGITPADGRPSKPAFPGAYGKRKDRFGGKDSRGGKPRWKT